LACLRLGEPQIEIIKIMGINKLSKAKKKINKLAAAKVICN